MLKNTDKLQVLPNPWLMLDADGDPQCAVLREVGNGVGWIGARRDPKAGKFIFSDKPVTATATPYVRARINNGELIVVDKAAAESLQISFIDPEKLLAQYRSKAIADYDAQHGECAWKLSYDARSAAARAALEVEKAEATAQDSPAPAKSGRKTTATE